MKPRILVVEDDPLNRKLLVDLLQVNDYEVSVALDGRQGVEQARALLPDLILMDIQMPVMDGYEAVRHLKSDAQTRAIPVWALTSYAMAADVSRIYAAGYDDCLTKPYNVAELLRRIAACCGAQGGQRHG